MLTLHISVIIGKRNHVSHVWIYLVESVLKNAVTKRVSKSTRGQPPASVLLARISVD